MRLEFRTDDNVLIQAHPKRHKWATHTYIDKQGKVLNSPSFRQKGYVFEYLRLSDGLVLIHMPLKLMDKVLGGVVKRLKSFKSAISVISVHRNREQSLKNPKSCLQDFTLSFSDWESFKSVAERYNWELRNLSEPVDTLLQEIDKQLEEADKVNQEVAKVRKEVGKIKNTKDLETFLSSVETLKVHVANLRARYLKHYSKVVKALEEDRPLSEKGRLEHRLETFKSLGSLSFDLDLDKLYKRAVARYRKVTGETSVGHPLWLGSLKEEIDSLRSFFPALRYIQVENESIVLDLGTKIILSAKGIKIEGDLLTLAPFTQCALLPEKSGDEGSRFSSIIIIDDEE